MEVESEKLGEEGSVCDVMGSDSSVTPVHRDTWGENGCNDDVIISHSHTDTCSFS